MDTLVNVTVATPDFSSAEGDILDGWDTPSQIEPIDTVWLSDSSERQLQNQLWVIHLYSRAGRTRPGVYFPVAPSRFRFASLSLNRLSG